MSACGALLAGQWATRETPSSHTAAPRPLVFTGEHIHLGYYTKEVRALGKSAVSADLSLTYRSPRLSCQEQAAGYKKKDFKQSKYDFVDKMLEFAGAPAAPAKVLDVGCGIGGSTRYLARKFGPSTSMTGITLSPNQVARATQLAADGGLGNCEFRVMDALAMQFPDNTFDLVWACESGEHMPDKKRYVEEMTRVLKPGGKLVIATWCQRETTAETPFTEQENDELRFLYEEWSHPYFISIEEYERLLKGTGVMETVHSEDWAPFTIPAWRHSIWVGVWDPWPVVARPRVWYKTLRDAWCLERMHRAFDKGLMKYGMLTAKKAVV